MSRREKGTYGVLDKTVLAYAKRHRDASVSVLIALAERSNYTRTPSLRVAELMLETDLKERAVEKCLVRLMASGLCVREADGWAYRQPNSKATDSANGEANHDANDDANQDANGEAYSGTPIEPEKAVQDEESQLPKEVEGRRRKEKEGNKEKEPPTPQGEAQNGAARMGSDSQAEGIAEPTPAKPRRPRTPALPVPALPADLAALPGVPEAWANWLQYRAETKLATPPTTAEAQFAKLRTLHAQGQDLPAVIEHAVEHLWKSFFPLKSEAPRRENLKFNPPPTELDERKDWLA